MKKYILLILLIGFFSSSGLTAEKIPALPWEGKTKKELIKQFGKTNIFSYREEGNHLWISFYDKTEPENLLTFHLLGDKTFDYTINDRPELVKEYLGEFASGNILGYFGNIRTALQSALGKLPNDVFLSVTERSRPTLFVDVYTTGIARYANALEFNMREDDAPVFQNGFYLIKLGDELDKVSDPQAIEGIIFHELAHRVLNHLNTQGESCDMEREANRMVKQWGFEKEFLKAKEAFGSKQKGDLPAGRQDSPCSDKLH